LLERKAAGRPRIRAVHPLESALARCRSQIPAAAPISPALRSLTPLLVLAGSAGAPDHVAIRGVWVATASASDRASIAVSVAADAATPAGRSLAGTLARLCDGTAGSAAERGPNLWPLDPILRPNIAPTFAFPPATFAFAPIGKAMDNAKADAAIHPRVSGPQRGRLLRPTDVARRLSVHRNTVYRLIENGRLPALPTGRREVRATH
jgi:excisionase family DNA binding protein